ncbi:Ger(x)C family spore germination protein [Fictibacillus barbaricus]|uniref:Spore germination protein KC n=1 Tax=Fictibacillus barbaricus TaxID=182136 RepID=A0ABU1TWK8_9BACL|nr:Ger(x)C family spore germination protein [Fictibacillus barbaricus]MDR7071571.1 spore germination protein KC [Fictibacillus barbaricus]
MFYKKLILLFLLTLSPLLSGCWNNRELEELGLAVAMGIDKEDGKYVVTVQLVNPSSIASKQMDTTRAPVVTYQEKGDTIFDAIRRLTKTSPRKTFYPHLKVLVLGEKIAKEGFSKSLDLLARDQEFRSDFFVVVAKGHRADEVLNILVPVEKIAAQNIFSKLKTSEEVFAPSYALTFGKLIDDLTSEGTEPVITGLKITGNPKEGEKMSNLQTANPKVRLKYINLAVFKKDKLKGWLNEHESKGYNYFNDNVKSTIVTVPCLDKKKDRLSVEIIDTHTKVKSKMENGIPHVHAEVNAKANVGEVGCSINLTKQATIDEIQKLVEHDIHGKITEAIIAAQKKYKIDFLGAGKVIHRADPKYWKRAKKGWDEKFVNIKITSKVNVHIDKIGKNSNSFLNEFDKK